MARGRSGRHTRPAGRGDPRRVGHQERAIYPVLFRIGEFEVTSFGVLVAVAALAGLWLFERERRRSGLPDNTLDAGMAGVLGGLAGAKLVWAIEHADRGSPSSTCSCRAAV